MKVRTASLVAVLVSGLGIAATGFRIVQPGEQVVVRRWGRLIEPAWGPGPHLGLPLGIDRLERVRTDQVRRLVVGGPEPPSEPGSGEFLTGDLNLIQVRAVVQYRVAQPGDWLIRSAGAEELLECLAAASLNRALARRDIDSALREDRPRIGAEVATALGGDVLRLRLGVEILAVSLTDARPPAEVAPDFAAAQASESQRNRRGHEARAAAETTVSAAAAQAARILDAARSQSQRIQLAARAQAQSFEALRSEAQRDRRLTEQRLYLDAMRRLLGGVGRSIIVPPGDVVDLTVLGVDE